MSDKHRELGPTATLDRLALATAARLATHAHDSSTAVWLAARIISAALARAGHPRARARFTPPTSRLTPLQLATWYGAATETALAS